MGITKSLGFFFLEKLKKESRVVFIPMFPSMFPCFFSVRATIPIANSKTSSRKLQLLETTSSGNSCEVSNQFWDESLNHSRHRHHLKGIFSQEFHRPLLINFKSVPSAVDSESTGLSLVFPNIFPRKIWRFFCHHFP